jgi:hypothetical protein
LPREISVKFERSRGWRPRNVEAKYGVGKFDRDCAEGIHCT